MFSGEADRYMEQVAHRDEAALHAALAAGDEEGILSASGGAAYLGTCALTEVCARPSLRTVALVDRLLARMPASGMSRENREAPLVNLFRNDPAAVSGDLWDRLIVPATDFWAVVVENPWEDGRDQQETPLWVLALAAGPHDILERMETAGWSALDVARRASSQKNASYTHPLAALVSRVTANGWYGPGVLNAWTPARVSAFHSIAAGLLAQGGSWDDAHPGSPPEAPSSILSRLMILAPSLGAEIQARRRAEELERHLPSAPPSARPRM